MRCDEFRSLYLPCPAIMELKCEPPSIGRECFLPRAASNSLRPSELSIMLSPAPCTTSSGEPMLATLLPASKRCVISGPIGSQRHFIELATSAMEVKAPSTIVPCSVSTFDARLMAMAPPSEWAKM